MYPEFIMDGIEYTAERNYTHVAGIPVAVIRCTIKKNINMIEKNGIKILCMR